MPEIKNPNQQGGGQDSRTLLVFSVLFLVVFLGLQYFRKKAPEAAPAQQHAAQSQSSTPDPQPENGAAPLTAPSGPLADRKSVV